MKYLVGKNTMCKGDAHKLESHVNNVERSSHRKLGGTGIQKTCQQQPAALGQIKIGSST